MFIMFHSVVEATPVVLSSCGTRAGCLLHSVRLERAFSSFKGTRDNRFKLKEVKFRLDTRKKFFTLRLLRHWNRLPREVQDAQSLEAFKVRLVGAFSNLIY